ncbi:MAG TPA: hypothetical protein VG917_01175 [Patescibacteria group bacterium]|nr:hypothetical protein [Patescibacteria group bacterium]
MVQESGRLMLYREMMASRGVKFSPGEQLRRGNDIAVDTMNILNRVDVAKGLEDLKSRLPDQYRTPVFIASWYTSQQVVVLAEQVARLKFNAASFEDFVAWYDISMGAAQVTGTIEMVQMRSSGLEELSDELIAQAIGITEPIMHGNHSSLIHEAEVYLANQNFLNSSLKLLKEDDTGFKLADEIVKYTAGERNKLIKNGSFASGNSMKGLVARGASLAAEVYKSVYSKAIAIPNGE